MSSNASRMLSEIFCKAGSKGNERTYIGLCIATIRHEIVSLRRRAEDKSARSQAA